MLTKVYINWGPPLRTRLQTPTTVKYGSKQKLFLWDFFLGTLGKYFGNLYVPTCILLYILVGGTFIFNVYFGGGTSIFNVYFGGGRLYLMYILVGETSF